MRSRKNFLYALVLGVGVGVLMAGLVGAQSVGIGNALIDVLDTEGDTVFHVDTDSVDIGGTGTDTDLYIRTSTGTQALRFNTSGADMYMGSMGNPGDLLIYDAANSWTFYHNGSSGDLTLGGGTHDGDLLLKNSTGVYSIVADGGTGDLTLGGGTVDGDIILKDHTTGLTNFNADGSQGVLTLGSYGTAGDAGSIYLRDTNGITNNVSIVGNAGDAFLGQTSSGDDGDLSLSDGASDNSAIDLEGSNGTITNKLSGNGIVKAWAKINSTGTIQSCFRCNLSTAETRKLATGQYEVDFTSVGTSIATRPVLCTPGHTSSNVLGGRQISCTLRTGDLSSIFVATNNSSGSLLDSNFTIVMF